MANGYPMWRNGAQSGIPPRRPNLPQSSVPPPMPHNMPPVQNPVPSVPPPSPPPERPPEPPSPLPLNSFVSSLTERLGHPDGETLLLLGILWLLYKEKADPKLLLALAYILL